VFECVSVVGISSPLLQTFLLNEMILALLRVRGKKKQWLMNVGRVWFSTTPCYSRVEAPTPADVAVWIANQVRHATALCIDLQQRNSPQVSWPFLAPQVCRRHSAYGKFQLGTKHTRSLWCMAGASNLQDLLVRSPSPRPLGSGW